MKAVFFVSDKPREHALADAVIRGMEVHGDEGVKRSLDGTAPVADGDLACFVGVKSREIYRANRQAGVHTVMFDKGYVRNRLPCSKSWKYWRVAVDGHHPTDAIEDKQFPPNRLDDLGLEIKPWRKRGRHVLIAGSSAKYHAFYGLPDPTTYAMGLVRRLREYTDRPIVYRPKPSWRGACPIAGTRLSEPSESLDDALGGAWAMITHGSNACFEAALMGIPSIVLGNAVARPISSRCLSAIEDPHLSSFRRQWLANLAFCQWTEDEFASGMAWETIKGQIV